MGGPWSPLSQPKSEVTEARMGWVVATGQDKEDREVCLGFSGLPTLVSLSLAPQLPWPFPDSSSLLSTAHLFERCLPDSSDDTHSHHPA